MENFIKEHGGVLLFYLFIVICIMIVNMRINYLEANYEEPTNSNFAYVPQNN